MSWVDWIPAIIEGIGLIQDRDSASPPDPIQQIDMEKLSRLMQMNTRSPWGGITYSEGPDGRVTAEYALTEQQQPIFDNQINRAMNPDQAYQMPPQLQALQEALMNQRLGAVGGPISSTSPRPERRPYAPSGGRASTTPFTATAAEPEATGRPRTPMGEAPRGGVNRDPMSGAGNRSRTPYFNPGQSAGRSFNDTLDDEFGSPLEGTNPNAAQRLLVEHGGTLANGLLGGPPGLGMLFQSLIDSNYWQDHQWQNPAPPERPGINDYVDQAMYESPYNMDTLNPQQSPVERGTRFTGEHANIGSDAGPGRPGSQWSYAFGSGGPWYRNSGRLLFRPRGF